MQLVTEIGEESEVTLRHQPPLSDDAFFDFCVANSDFRIERSAEGEIEIMPPAGGECSDQNSEIGFQLRAWNKKKRTGKVLDSNGGFLLPNGAMRSPDACWIELSRVRSLTRQEWEKFPCLCPDFVVELASPSDRLSRLQAKMREYIDNGAQLGWLIDPKTRSVYIYRPGREPERLIEQDQVKGEGPVDGFVLDLREIWNPL